ncbi:hypothetical protein [Herbiconiux sp. YIM B11900]|uniref:hypothetical protein n=1 Tax=Herbiconiux sp. YIM B11900 TaxID=3404131 RepID=UPI003F8403C2
MGIRRTATLTGLVFALAVTASGCAGSPEPAPTATVTVTATAAPATPTAVPTTDPAPDPAAYVADDPATWVISYAGIGPLDLDSTLGAIQTEMPVAVATCRPGVDTYSVDGLGLTAVTGNDETDPAAPIQVVRLLPLDAWSPGSPAPLTEKGIGLGSTVAQLQAAYPELDTSVGPNKTTVYQIAADGRTINFEDYGTGAITAISVVVGTSVASEYCGA